MQGRLESRRRRSLFVLGRDVTDRLGHDEDESVECVKLHHESSLFS